MRKKSETGGLAIVQEIAVYSLSHDKKSQKERENNYPTNVCSRAVKT